MIRSLGSKYTDMSYYKPQLINVGLFTNPYQGFVVFFFVYKTLFLLALKDFVLKVYGFIYIYVL
jgi:hypothetical protein